MKRGLQNSVHAGLVLSPLLLALSGVLMPKLGARLGRIEWAADLGSGSDKRFPPKKYLVEKKKGLITGD